MALVLGVSCYFHDAAAALVEDGALVCAAEEERFTRRKHDASFPARAIAFCRAEAERRGREIEYVAFYEDPRLKLRRVLATAATMGKPAADAFAYSMREWLTERRGIRRRLSRLLGVPKDRVVFVGHHLSHAASAFFPSPFQSAAVVTVDGVGEWATATIGRASSANGRHELELLDEVDFPHSLGLFYSACTDFLGFEVNEGEYKVMGMAPYGEPRFLDELGRVLRLFDDGSFWLDLSYFSYHYSSRRAFEPKLATLLGIEPRRRDEPFVAPDDPEATAEQKARSRRYADIAASVQALTERAVVGLARAAQRRTGATDLCLAGGVALNDPEATAEQKARSRRYADIAASVQALTERAVVGLARAAQRRTGATDLCLAGGVALNALANRRVLEETAIERLFIPPAPGDSGGALGAALHVEHALLGSARRSSLEHAYWGAAYGETEVEAALRAAAGIEHRRLDDEDALLDATVEALAAGEVVGWFQGRFELGPRALGNRSILADPRRPEMKARINEKIKFREPFRPFAPAVAEEAAAALVPREQAEQHPARFMLLICELQPAMAAKVQAVDHFGTARLQTVREEWNPRFFRLLKRWERASGLPVLLNTSFNLRGEPIVATPADALETFRRSGLDLLVLGDVIARKARR